MAGNSAQEVVEQFLAEWDTLGFEQAYLNHLSEDAVWRNLGYPDCEGLPTIMAALRKYNEIFQRPHAKVEIKHILSRGDVVLVERVEDLYSKDHEKRSVSQNMSSFIVKGGKIVEWNDYFDTAPYRKS